LRGLHVRDFPQTFREQIIQCIQVQGKKNVRAPLWQLRKWISALKTDVWCVG
jgi:hypothetical protein